MSGRVQLGRPVATGGEPRRVHTYSAPECSCRSTHDLSSAHVSAPQNLQVMTYILCMPVTRPPNDAHRSGDGIMPRRMSETLRSLSSLA